MSLEGLRAWIGEVERKLGMRTRVFLVLTVIALGVGGAAIYLAIDARESSVSEGDVQALQEQLEARIAAGAGGTTGTASAQLESELRTLQAEVAELKSATGKPKQGAKGEDGGESGGGGAADESSGNRSSGSSGGGNASQPLEGTSGGETSGGGASGTKPKDAIAGAQPGTSQSGAE